MLELDSSALEARLSIDCRDVGEGGGRLADVLGRLLARLEDGADAVGEPRERVLDRRRRLGELRAARLVALLGLGHPIGKGGKLSVDARGFGRDACRGAHPLALAGAHGGLHEIGELAGEVVAAGAGVLLAGGGALGQRRDLAGLRLGLQLGVHQPIAQGVELVARRPGLLLRAPEAVGQRSDLAAVVAGLVLAGGDALGGGGQLGVELTHLGRGTRRRAATLALGGALHGLEESGHVDRGAAGGLLEPGNLLRELDAALRDLVDLVVRLGQLAGGALGEARALASRRSAQRFEERAEGRALLPAARGVHGDASRDPEHHEELVRGVGDDRALEKEADEDPCGS